MSKIRTISNEQRDTHFKNYARIVFDDVEGMFVKLSLALGSEEEARITHDIQLFLARRLYDLACHVGDELVGDDYSIANVSDYPKKKEGETHHG